MMKCILHIGCEKTGTTSIQSFIRDNKSALELSGVFVPQSCYFPNAVWFPIACMDRDRDNHVTIGLGLQNNRPKRDKWCEEMINSIAREISEASDKYHTLLISSEYFSSKISTPAEIARVKAILEMAGIEEIEVVIYLRSQLEFTISRQSTAMISSTLIDGTSEHGSESMLGKPGWLLDYESILSKWSEVFGEKSLHPRLYDEAKLYNTDVVADFFTSACQFGLPADLFGNKKEANQSLNAKAQRALQSFNENINMLGIHATKKNQLRRDFLAYLESNHRGEPFMPLKAECIAFQNQFIESNQKLSNRWFGGRKILSPDYSKYPESYDIYSYSFEDAIELMVGLLADSTTENNSESAADNTTKQVA